MLKHVGRYHYDTFFVSFFQSLERDGVAVINSIGRTDSDGQITRGLKNTSFLAAISPV